MRGETTKDKAGALPLAVYTQQHNFNKEDLMAGLANDPYTEYRVVFSREKEREFVQATSEGGDVTEVTFVDDCLKRSLRKMSVKPTQKMTFLIGMARILRR